MSPIQLSGMSDVNNTTARYIVCTCMHVCARGGGVVRCGCDGCVGGWVDVDVGVWLGVCESV